MKTNITARFISYFLQEFLRYGLLLNLKLSNFPLNLPILIIHHFFFGSPNPKSKRVFCNWISELLTLFTLDSGCGTRNPGTRLRSSLKSRHLI